MKRWLRKKLLKLLNEGEQDQVVRESTGYLSNAIKGSTIGSSSSINSEPTLNFTVFSAVGGKVVEFRRYDRKTERSDSTMYVIGHDQDFGERIAKIATMENLKA
jgi:hypothetical protein